MAALHASKMLTTCAVAPLFHQRAPCPGCDLLFLDGLHPGVGGLPGPLGPRTGKMRTDIVTGTLITCLLVTVCALVPVVGLMGTVFIPVPVMFYRAKTGRQAAARHRGGSPRFCQPAGGRPGARVFRRVPPHRPGLMGELMPRGYSIERTAGIVCAAVFAFGLAGLAVLRHFYRNGALSTSFPRRHASTWS